MIRTYWLLVETQSGYRLTKAGDDPMVGDIVASPDLIPTEIAAAVQKRLDELAYRGEPMLLATGSQNALAATFPCTNQAMARKHDAMAYAMEEFLPLAAEEIVCDFVVLGDEALGVGADVNALRPLLSSLEECGIVIASIVPTAILTLQRYVKNGGSRGRQIIAWQYEDTVDLFELIDGKPRAWRLLPASSEPLAREIQILGSASGVDEVRLCNFSDELREAGGAEVAFDGQHPLLAASKSAAAVLTGREQPWIELRREPLGKYDPYRPIRGSLRICVIAAACILLSLSIAACIRADKYERVVEQYQQEQVSFFRRVFPGKRVPVGIFVRFESEQRRLAGVTGRLEGVPQLESAARLLRDVLAPLPEDLRYRLLEIRLEGDNVYLDGEIRSHGDADLLATALRDNGFQVDAPHTEQLAETGVAVTITATRQSNEATKQKAEATP